MAKEQYGTEQSELLRPSLSSVFWKFLMAKYHCEESVKAIQNSLPQNNDDEKIKIIKLIFLTASNHENSKEFKLAKFCAEAHFIAFAQALHSVVDIMAQVIVFALNLNNDSDGRLSEKSNMHDVRKYLQSHADFTEIAAAIEELIESDQYKYLTAYTNITKHRSLVAKNYSVNLDYSQNQTHGFKINDFKYKGMSFSEKWAVDVCNDDHQYIHEQILRIGNLLNSHVASI